MIFRTFLENTIIRVCGESLPPVVWVEARIAAARLRDLEDPV